MTVALLLLSRLGVDTPYWQVALYIFLFGAGLGFTMQTIVTAVQNSVEHRDMGAATSSDHLLPRRWAARSGRPCSGPCCPAGSPTT